MLITFGFSKIKPIEICVMQKSTTLSDKQVKFLNSSEWECIRVRADSGSVSYSPLQSLRRTGWLPGYFVLDMLFYYLMTLPI